MRNKNKNLNFVQRGTTRHLTIGKEHTNSEGVQSFSGKFIDD